ncbi:MAG: HAMP domain-containing sensor histidine kinase [Bacteroidota bacterium]
MSGFLVEDTDQYDPETKEVITTLHKSSKETYNLLENLLAWANSKSRLDNPVIEQLHLKELVKSNFELAHQKALDKSIKLESNLTENTKVYGDPRMISTILRNLIFNAMKFTPENGEIKVYDVETKEGEVVFCVKDTGLGMSAEQVEKLFTNARLASTLGTNEETGTGLGLQLCKELIEKMKGDIWVESEQGGGSRFYFSLPMVK